MNKSKKQRGFVLWFTGFSAAGKTTIADRVFEMLKGGSVKLERLDGDIVRANLTKGLSYSKADRDENIKRIGFVANLLSRNGVGVIASFISPYEKQREGLRNNIENFIEVFVDTSLDICESRDPKGMYKMARAGEIKSFTGVSDPYESPKNPDIHLSSGESSIDDCAETVIDYLKKENYL
jgi:adenylyl-sulfate kinase